MTHSRSCECPEGHKSRQLKVENQETKAMWEARERAQGMIQTDLSVVNSLLFITGEISSLTYIFCNIFAISQWH